MIHGSLAEAVQVQLVPESVDEKVSEAKTIGDNSGGVGAQAKSATVLRDRVCDSSRGDGAGTADTGIGLNVEGDPGSACAICRGQGDEPRNVNTGGPSTSGAIGSEGEVVEAGAIDRGVGAAAVQAEAAGVLRDGMSLSGGEDVAGSSLAICVREHGVVDGSVAVSQRRGGVDDPCDIGTGRPDAGGCRWRVIEKELSPPLTAKLWLLSTSGVVKP